MPKSGVKQKTGQKVKVKTRSPFENTNIPKHAQSDDDMDDETSSDEDDVPEKDEAEKKLERLLFGDDAGFHGALKSQGHDSMALTVQTDDSASGEEEGEGDDKGLEDMADADVRGDFALVEYLGALADYSLYSFSSLTPGLRLSRPISPMPPRHYQMAKRKVRMHLQSGRIATTSASTSPWPASSD